MNWKPFLSYVTVNLKLTWRDRTVIFFNVLFPMLFFFIFAELARAEQGGVIKQVYSSVIVIGVLGNGFFGGGIRAVVERENNILRRFKVAPISPAPILVSAATVGLVTFLPTVILLFAISHFRYGMALPERWLSALAMIVVGTVAFRTLGQIVASVANSMAEYQIIVQSLYFPMLFLSGSTFPLSALPKWLQTVTQFIPSTYLYSGLQNILVRGETLGANLGAVFALLVTAALCLFLAMKLFRWEKEEKVKASAKLWLAAVLLPFIATGAYQAYSGQNLSKSRIVARELRRSRTLLFRDARIFTATGDTLARGGVLVRDGKIAAVYRDTIPDAQSLKAEAIEASGKTLLPALADAGVRLLAPGGVPDPANPLRKPVLRALAAYLFSGVAYTGSLDGAPEALADAQTIVTGETLGAEPVVRAAPIQPKSLVELDSALRSGAKAIGGADLNEAIPAAVLQSMAAQGVTFVPFLAVVEARALGRQVMDRSLVEQTAFPALLTNTRKQPAAPYSGSRPRLDVAQSNLERAYAASVPLLMASGSGAMFLPHGPAIHRELQLWVEAGVPAAEALRVATVLNARWLGVAEGAGAIEPNREASLLLVNGNPLQEISATEAISLVVFKGERVDRAALLDPEENP